MAVKQWKSGKEILKCQERMKTIKDRQISKTEVDASINNE